MSKGKNRKAKYHSINEKFAHKKLQKIDNLMDQLRRQVGRKGDGNTGKTLIGAVERLNEQARDGVALTKAYKKFNTSTLPTFKSQISNMDFEFNVIDALAK